MKRFVGPGTAPGYALLAIAALIEILTGVGMGVAWGIALGLAVVGIWIVFDPGGFQLWRQQHGPFAKRS